MDKYLSTQIFCTKNSDNCGIQWLWWDQEKYSEIHHFHDFIWEDGCGLQIN